MVDPKNLSNIIESILFGAGRPMRLSEMKTLLGSQNMDVDLPSIRIALSLLEERFVETSIEIKEVASGFRMQIKEEYGNYLYPLWNDSSNRLSKALMETVSIVAYKQPVTRGDIEDIRGVTVSTQIIRSLLDREWIKVSGYRDVPGRPALYETTKTFLNDLNLKSNEMNADRSTTHAVISSCLDRRARPGGRDMSAWRLEMFLARRTLLRTRRTITSATVEFRLEPNGVARLVADLSFRRLAAFCPGGAESASLFLVASAVAAVVAIAMSATVVPSFVSVALSP